MNRFLKVILGLFVLIVVGLQIDLSKRSSRKMAKPLSNTITTKTKSIFEHEEFKVTEVNLNEVNSMDKPKASDSKKVSKKTSKKKNKKMAAKKGKKKSKKKKVAKKDKKKDEKKDKETKQAKSDNTSNSPIAGSYHNQEPILNQNEWLTYLTNQPNQDKFLEFVDEYNNGNITEEDFNIVVIGCLQHQNNLVFKGALFILEQSPSPDHYVLGLESYYKVKMSSQRKEVLYKFHFEHYSNLENISKVKTAFKTATENIKIISANIFKYSAQINMKKARGRNVPLKNAAFFISLAEFALEASSQDSKAVQDEVNDFMDFVNSIGQIASI